MSVTKSRRGFILPTTIVMVAIASIVIAAVGGYVAQAARMTRIHRARSRCRLAAQSAVEQAKSEVQAGFAKYVGGSGGASIKIDPRQADVYNWFDTVSADHRTIGISDAKHDAVTLVDPPNGINGCEISVGIGMFVDHPSGSSFASVPIVATAAYRYPDGLTVTATIQERVAFGTGQSPVFDYAYFVNNYGWMNGSSIVINGDMRANGNVNLSASTVNGFVYAAANDEVNADGTVTLSSSPQIKSASSYRTAYGSRSRPDTGDYDTAGAYDAPSASGTIRKPSYTYEGGEIVAANGGTRAALSNKPIVNEYSDSLPMPFVSVLNDYVEYARDYDGGAGGRLTHPAYSYTDSAGAVHNVAGGTVSSHYSGAGPSGDAALADKGALVLIGTQANPIVIDGPVVVDSDVIIKGYVKGQGTIYSGRNVHIIGDVKYVNPPVWSHPDADDAAVEAANAKKDMLGLVAKGNIVIGDSSADNATWHNSVDGYIKSGTSSSVVKKYACDPSDADIGYPATFQGNYTAVEDVNGQKFGKVRPVAVQKTREEHYQERYVTGYNRWGQAQYGYRDAVRQVSYTETVLGNEMNRRYYETVCDDNILKKLKDTSGIAQIDAILYNNHGIFGTPGRNNANFNLNGSLVCRDEALIFSGNGIRFNWDMRLRRKNNRDVNTRVGLPVGPQDPYTVEWLEVSDELNPVYAAKGGGGDD